METPLANHIIVVNNIYPEIQKTLNQSKDEITNMLLQVEIDNFILDLKNKDNFLRTNLNIYFYLLKQFNIKIRKGETLKSFSSRLKDYYPKIKKDIKKILKLYYSYKFSNKKFSSLLKNNSISEIIFFKNEKFFN